MIDYGHAAASSAAIMLFVALGSFIFSAAVIALLFYTVGLFTKWQQGNKVALGQALFFAFPFSVLGVTVGFVTSLSRESAVGTVLPAILALVGGVCVYLVSKGGRSAITSAVAVVMLCVSFSAGVGYGSEARVENEQNALSPATQRALANREANIKRYRKSVGLDDEVVRPPIPASKP
ncbi:hypothetical protein [Mesorhizobium sp. M8A.F.Ca.ET.021.01.1.1]|uniref:hypothetical protein n=1 Tax=Mesorhizobium sp. M8A.F.Ca.ET.021.01.1.1 TaxID=2496757 RepID=UPI000FCBC641|nr:hypothetical protein [Mesorhizobium sp. M8A.F.Ca.ET.021.01.1.1]RUW57008.1 hypothetical protein EOA36_01470 [Mesorhizobium sp. M8A.F.Ca.ET.021.01.1.1]